MKISLSNGREVTLKRTEYGEWIGEGHGYRFRATQYYGRGLGRQWTCRVRPLKGAMLASYRASTLKIAVQNAAHAADLERAERAHPLAERAQPKHEFHCDCNDCEHFRAEYGS